jgi:hypothetical protein
LRRRDVGGHARQGLRAVHEEVEPDLRPRRERAGLGPAVRRRVERASAPDPRQAAPVVPADEVVDPVADRVVDAVERVDRQCPSFWGAGL